MLVPPLSVDTDVSKEGSPGPCPWKEGSLPESDSRSRPAPGRMGSSLSLSLALALALSRSFPSVPAMNDSNGPTGRLSLAEQPLCCSASLFDLLVWLLFKRAFAMLTSKSYLLYPDQSQHLNLGVFIKNWVLAN